MNQLDTEHEHPILALEREALRRWCQGDPSGFLEISAPEVVYFDPFIGRRLDGLEALSRYYEGLRGQVFASRFEILNPFIQPLEGGAVLTFNFVSWDGTGNEHRWNCTEVYRCREGAWKIIQTHWSLMGGGSSL
jgi:hypothetical protein